MEKDTLPGVAMHWRPIVTAPTEENVWFLAASVGRVHLACRVDGAIFDVGIDPESGDIGLYIPDFMFTHWMELPAPPPIVQ